MNLINLLNQINSFIWGLPLLILLVYTSNISHGAMYYIVNGMVKKYSSVLI